MLLTSQGLTNATLVAELRDLVGKGFSDASLAFIPTAAVHLDQDLGVLLDDMARCRDLGLAFFDIVELAALSSEDVRRRLTRADVRPHLDHPDFPTSQESMVATTAPLLPGTLYAIDDNSALRVTDGGVRPVGEGRVLTYENGSRRP